ncbi:hypothetical protein ROZALSC1DRAFT_29898, partial [Rozella allomycis CSF55]
MVSQTAFNKEQVYQSLVSSDNLSVSLSKHFFDYLVETPEPVALASTLVEYYQSLKEPMQQEFENLVLDAIYSLDVIFELDLTILAEVVSRLFECGFPVNLMKERLEPGLLEAAGIIPSATMFSRRIVRINTQKVYRQTKFNLLREESEGFAKLAVCLFEGADVDDTLGKVLELIGYFDLDISRVVDVIFDVWMENGRWEFYVGLLKRLSVGDVMVSNVLGFKLEYFEKNKAETPSGLLMVVGYCIKHGLVPIDMIYGHISPDDEEMEKEMEKFVENVKECSKNTGVVSLNATAETNDSVSRESLFATKNQKASIIEVLFKVDCSELGLKMVAHFPNLVGYFPRLANTISKWIESKLDLLCGFRLTEVKDLNNKYKTIKEFEENIEDLLDYLDVYLSPGLIAKICRIGKMSIEEDANRIKFWIKLTRRYLLPSFSLCECNPGLANDLWGLLKCFSYKQRFGLYGKWKNEIYEESELLGLARSETSYFMKRAMKRLSKDNVKQFGRVIGKICHNNPLIAFGILIDQVQAYDNLVQPSVDALKYLTEFGYDCVSFILIESLSNPEKDRLKSDGTFINSWLTNLALFTGTFYKKYPVSLEPILQYVFNQLKDGNVFDLIVLKELIEKMSGIEQLEDLSEHQIACSAASSLLKSLSINSQSVLRNNKRPADRLYSCLKEMDIGWPLFILLCQLKDLCLFVQSDLNHLKLLGNLVDECQNVIQQFKEFIFDHEKPKMKFNEIIFDFKLNPEFSLYLSDRSEIIKELDVLPEEMWNGITREFYSLFWRLELKDLEFPKEAYEIELNKQTELLKETDLDKKKTREKIQETIDKLKMDFAIQENKVKETLDLLKTIKNDLFKDFEYLFNYCLFPRIIQSQTDAIYCSKLIFLLHELNTDNFSTLSVLNKIISEISNLIFLLTEKEANCFGKFYNAIFTKLNEWFNKSELYVKECVGVEEDFKQGFNKLWNQEKKIEISNVMNFNEFRNVYFKWNIKLFNSLEACLKSKEFMQIKNVLIILTKISENFPRIKKVGENLDKLISKLRDEENREDLKLLATRYSSILKLNKEKWINEISLRNNQNENEREKDKEKLEKDS